MDRHFGGLIWTDHALDRMRRRGIKQSDAWATWRNPDLSEYARIKGAFVYKKTWGNQSMRVVAKKNEKKEWVILSVWTKQEKETLKPTSLFRRLLKMLSF